MADVLTGLRIILILPISIFALQGNQAGVFVLYALAAATDALDGYAARRIGPSGHGAYFDGAADLIFGLATLWWLWVLFPAVYTAYGVYILVAAITVLICAGVSLIKTRAVVMPHLPLAKLATAAVYLLLPAFILLGVIELLVHAAWILVVGSRLEIIGKLFTGEITG